MAKNIQETVGDAGKTVVDAAKKLGEGIVEGAEHAVQSVRNMATSEGDDVGTQGIREHMQVYASCGKCVGSVDHLEDNTLKLTRKDSPDGLHHYIPLSWIDHVDTHVHLNKNSVETELNWKPSAAACEC